MSKKLMPYGSEKFAGLAAKLGGNKAARAAKVGFMPYGSADHGAIVAKTADKGASLMPYGLAGRGELVAKAGVSKAGSLLPYGSDEHADRVAKVLAEKKPDGARRVVRLNARG